MQIRSDWFNNSERDLSGGDSDIEKLEIDQLFALICKLGGRLIDKQQGGGIWVEEMSDIGKLELMSWLYLVASYGRLIDWNYVGICCVEKTNDINKLNINQLIGFSWN